MTMGLYKVGENQPIIRLRRGRNGRGQVVHAVPHIGSTGGSICEVRPTVGSSWRWTDDNIDCKVCLPRVQAKLRDGSLLLADPAVVAEFERQMLANVGDREPDRLAVEIYRPRDGVMGSVGTRREIHLVDCPLVGAVERPMVSLPVAEVLRMKNADSGRTSFCQECKPFHVLDNERRRPHTLAEARKLSEIEGSTARDRLRRKIGNPHQNYAFRTLPYDGSGHFEDCPAEADALMHGDITDPRYGRCTCYTRHSAVRPGERSYHDDSPDWTIG